MRRAITLFIVTMLGWAVPATGADGWTSFPGGRWRALTVPNQGHAGFQNLSPAETGVAFTNSLREADGALNRTFFNGSGVAAGDVDGDGRPDLVLAGLEGRLSLFRNLGLGTFTNATAESGLVATNFPNRGVVLADLNGDGASDLLVNTMGGGLRWFRNDGRGHFTEGEAPGGRSPRQGGMSLALADVDGNGTVDVYVVNNRLDDIRDRGEVQLRLVNGRPAVPPALTNRLTLVEGQVLEYGEPDRLLLNDGNGAFREVAWTGGAFTDDAGQPLTAPPLDWGLSATFRDFNNDGAPDLYVCNDFWTPDRIWLNDGQGHFRAAPALAFRQTSGSSMGVDLADLNGDNRPEIFVVDMLSRSLAERKQQMAAQPERSPEPGAITNRPQTLRNTLFLARPDGTYAEIAGFAGLTAAEWAWQPLFLDVDLDGHSDLLITSGHAHDVQDRDAEATVQSRQRSLRGIADPAARRRQFSQDLLKNLQVYPVLQTPIIAFRNRGDLSFEETTTPWGTDQAGVYHGLATADFDGDGDLDFAVNRLNGPAGVYRNASKAPRISVRLRGKAPNTAAVGAVVWLQVPGLPVQRQEVIGGGGYLSGSDPLLVFAVGTNSSPAELEIRWRDGTRRRMTDIGANREYEIAQDSRLDVAPTPEPSTPVTPWFEDQSTQLAHRHHEAPFDDFVRQPLLPRRLSQPGPGVVWADFDGDGWEDLAVGAGAGGRLAVWRNDKAGRFVPLDWPSSRAPLKRDLTGLAPLIEGPGVTILGGADNYENGATNASPVLEFGPSLTEARALLPGQADSTGPLALADVDGDGDLDLFVGGRVRAGRYPEPASSRLFRREGDHWKSDAATDALLANVGLVNGAVWTDLDADGFPDLVLACEWGPLRIFRNQRGQLTAWNPPLSGIAAAGTLEKLTGRWNGVTAGDFDGDGRMDLVAANWGENREDALPPGQAAWLVAGNWQGDGNLALIEAGWDPVRRALTPLRSLPELSAGMPGLAGRFPTFRAFSEATLDDVLGPQRAEAHEYRAMSLASVVLLNRGDRFEFQRLPAEAQLAPAFAPVVADFDGDGAEDIFLSQNFFAFRPGLPRRDAGRGLWLRGDGHGGFNPVESGAAGLKVDGEQRGAATADFDHDGRPDLVVTQNGAETRLFRNRGGRPGLRVTLTGPSSNPAGFGAQLQLCSGETCGPVREVHAGSGYGSADSAVTVLADPTPRDTPAVLRVLWPGGQRTQTSVPPGTKALTVRRP